MPTLPRSQLAPIALIVFAAAVVLASGCGAGSNYFVSVSNKRETAVIVRAGTTETKLEQKLEPGRSLLFDAATLDSYYRADYFVSVEPESGPDSRSLIVFFGPPDVKDTDETNPITLVVGPERVDVGGLLLSQKVDGAIVANDTGGVLEVGGDGTLELLAGERLGTALELSNDTLSLEVGGSALITMERKSENSPSFGAPIAVRQGPEGTSVVVAYYFREEWYRPSFTPKGVGNPQHPKNRNARVREVADIVENYYSEHGVLPLQDAVSLPDFSIGGDNYSWQEGCFLNCRQRERDDWFHFRVFQQGRIGEIYWICRSVWVGGFSIAKRKTTAK
jgi:hypothetical protein